METQQQHLFTCISCSIAFVSAEEQRMHYRSDHHRYNMKRRVAGLPPVSAAVFNEKVTERRTETAIMSSLKGSACQVCNKVYSSENAYRSHINSKKHKENELQASLKLAAKLARKDGLETDSEEEKSDEVPSSDMAAISLSDSQPKEHLPVSLVVDSSAAEDEVTQTIDQKIAAARSRLLPSHCLFCPSELSDLQANLLHMASAHSFFIPDADYLIDVEGLIHYLGEKIAVGNVCIFCNGKGREFRTLEAVRKHMTDKSHCKVAYDSQDDRLEISDYYDFTSSYPDGQGKEKKPKVDVDAEEEEWEDSDHDGSEADEMVDIDEGDSDDSDEDELPQNEITYGDSNYELVLPSGIRIGHRSMRRYYAQSFPGARRNAEEVDPNSGAAIVRRLLGDKNSVLVPRKGGFGAFGGGTDVVKARNKGEAREAGRHVREFRDQKRREDFKTKVGFKHNSQKHFRDPLLQ
ncbi:cytoplasmic protein [Rhodocollybia butyracea]|uniref:Cytoplasmic protein n=1 Tax=Rhodocollybia butyracea TaxID=206335 RepID=A0A9P5PXV0_9AGAR|nr:cytoplasmic protein [Rhodocollybia butyracea]